MGSRGPDWSHEETLVLAQMKKEAVMSNKKDRVWMCISYALSRQFNRARSEAQCQHRWDTIKKVYNKIEAYCAGESEDAHRHLDQQTLDSMELATAYREDWYTILKLVCLAEEDRRRKKRKKPSSANRQGIRHLPTNNNNNPTIPDQAVTTTAPNAHEAISCSPTVEAQSSSTDIENFKSKIEWLETLVRQQNQQILQLIQREQNAPLDQTIQWPQLDVKSEKTFNMPPGDSAGPGQVTEDIELPSQCFSPEILPNMDDMSHLLTYYRASVQRGLTRFSGQHDPNDSAANLSINLALFGRQCMPQSRSPYCDERKTTPTIHPRVTSKETQTVSSSHQVSKPVAISSNSALESDQKPFNPPFAETHQPTTDGLTERLAQMSLSSSQRLADPTTSQTMDLAKSPLTPGATVDDSSQMSSVTDRGIHKSSPAMVPMKPKAAKSHDR